MAVNFGKTTNMVEGALGAGDYQMYGVGNNPMAFREATRKGKFPSDNTGPDRSQGETSGAGSLYSAALNERPNISNPRNRGPERAPSRSAATPIPITTVTSRGTGRIIGE